MVIILNRTRAITIFSLFISITIIVVIAMKVHSSNVAAKYCISNNPTDIQENLSDFLGLNDTTVIKVVHLGKSNIYVACFKSELRGSILGIAKMKEGPNKKLRIINCNYGEGDVARYDGVKVINGNYGIITGKNSDKQMKSIRVELLNEPLNFMVQVPDDDFFVIVKRLPTEVYDNKYAHLYLFDKNNVEIKP